ncbi:MAG TPA: hypothetical protein DIT07_06130 [Sphingobacteriaceae bacterium]|nr:hypothetical protein [Sphingobacteriaceae bacterium]
MQTILFKDYTFNRFKKRTSFSYTKFSFCSNPGLYVIIDHTDLLICTIFKNLGKLITKII